MKYYTASERLNYSKMLDAYGSWLAPFPWDSYNHLTFAYKSESSKGKIQVIEKLVSPGGAKRMFDEAIGKLGEGIIYFRAIEWFPGNANVHIHCLIGNCKQKIPWEHGIYKIEPYNLKKGAIFYLAKLSLTNRADLDFRLY